MEADAYYENTGIRMIVVKEIRLIARECGIGKVILFGSRARGDYRERSDIDLAVTGGKTDFFALEIDEKTSTLLQYDVVNLDGPVQDELRKSIAEEGTILYEEIREFL